MRIFVSLSAPGFFTEDNHPDDAQEISTSLWHELLNGESGSGKMIDFTVFPPVLTDLPAPEPSPEELKRMAEGT